MDLMGLIAKIKMGMELTLDTFYLQERKTPFRTLLSRGDKWILRKVKSISDGDILMEEIEIPHSEVVRALADYIAREHGKEKKKGKAR